MGCWLLFGGTNPIRSGAPRYETSRPDHTQRKNAAAVYSYGASTEGHKLAPNVKNDLMVGRLALLPESFILHNDSSDSITVKRIARVFGLSCAINVSPGLVRYLGPDDIMVVMLLG